MQNVLVIGLIALASIFILPRLIARIVLKRRNKRDIVAIEAEIAKLESELGEEAEKAREMAGESISKAKIKRLSELYLRDLDIYKKSR